MPQVFDPDLVDYDLLIEQIEESGLHSLFYHTATNCVIAGARNVKEAVDSLEKFLIYK